MTQYQLTGLSGAFTAVTHTGTGTSATITGLTSDTSYEVQVRATNAEGASAWSTAVTARTNARIAEAGHSREVPENSASGTNVGAAIPEIPAIDHPGLTNFVYSMAGTDASSFSFNAATRQITTAAVFDHEDEDEYEVTIVVTSDTTIFDIPVDITVTDVAEPPSAPAAPAVTTSSTSNTGLSVSWTAPTNTGRPAITDYDVQYRQGTSGPWTSLTHTGTATTATITGLLNGRSYQVQVRATNAEGTSDWSPSGTGSTGSDPVFSATTQARSVAENSAAGTNVGAALPAATDADGDTLTYSMTGTDAASFDFNASTRRITTKTNVTYDHEAKSSYTVTVSATDGRGTASVTVTITVTDVSEPPSAPAAPTVTATSGTTDSLDVSWTAPTNTGKPAISDYDVQYREGNTGAFTAVTHTGTGTSATITGLTPGTAYQVQVRATNAEGTSGWSPSGSDSTSLPVITISGGPAVAEGANASFTVTASPAPASNLDVSVTVTDAPHGDFVAAANEGAQTVTITAGAATASFNVATVNDTVDEPGGRVTVTLVGGSDYTLGSTTSAGVDVTDNDPTTVTLSTPDTTATEGSTDTASIRVTLNRGLIEAANEAVDVPLSFAGGTAGTDFTLALQGSPAGVTFISSTSTLRFAAASGAVSAASATLTLTAVTDSDSTDEAVTVSLGAPVSTALTAGGGFTTSRTGDGVIALLEGVSTTTSGAYITRKVIPSAGVTRDGGGGWTLQEGTEIKVRFTNLQATLPSSPLMVYYYVTERIPHIYHIPEANRGYQHVTFAANQRHVDVTIPTRVSGAARSENPLWVMLMSADPRETPRAYWTNYRPLTFTITRAPSGGGQQSPQQGVNGATTEVTISAGAASATEGGTVTFTLSADPAPAADLTVEVLVEEVMGAGDDAVGGAQIATATIPAGQASATVTVTLMSDDVARADGTVSALVMTGDGYAPGDQDGVTLTLFDDDTPTSNLVAGGSFETPTVTAHGGTWHQFAAGTAGIEWTVTGGPLELMRGILGGASDGAQHAELDSTGSVTISQALSTVAGRTYTVAFDYKARPGTGAHTNGLTATWNGADIAAGITLGNAWRTHTAQVVGTGSDTLAFTDSGRSDGVGTFLDNVSVTPAPAQLQTQPQTPVLSISAGGGITEGGTASFTITATPAPTTPILVKVGVSQNGSFGARGAAAIAVSGASTTYTISTSDDNVDEPNGSVTAKLKDGGGYTVSSTSGAATVPVSDNDAPELSISAGAGITEGGTASFTITASSAPGSPITVNVGVSQSGSFGASGAATVTVSGTSTTYTISTTEDSTDEADGSVTATLKGGSGYTVSSTNGAATVSVADNDAPELSISAGAGITEGGTASFTITASSAPGSPITVNVGVSQSGAFGASGAATVTLSGTSTTYTIGTSDDHLDEADGSVTATLKGGSGYTVSSTNGAATVSVSDDDVPVVSISGASGITEGGTASFTITASPVPASPITVNVGVSQSGAFGASGAATVILSGTSTTYTISTSDDHLDEADGSVTATLKGGSGYTVSSTSGAATVLVSDNDDPPLQLRVSIDSASATEGGYLTFTVRLSHASGEQVVVSWNTAYAWGHVGDRAREGDDYEGRYVETITFAPGVTAQTEKIWLEADGEPEGDEVFAIELFLGEEWKLRPDATGMMTIIDVD